MSVHRDFADLLGCLNVAKVRYLMVGAYAVAIYTEPRYTKDIWVDATPANANKVYSALKAFGAPVMDVTVEDFANPEMVYQVGVEPVRVDIIMGLTGISFADAWKRRKKVVFGKHKANVIAMDDLIRVKKKSSRPQDKRDAERLSEKSRMKK